LVSIHIVENVHRLSWVGLALDWVLHKARSGRRGLKESCSLARSYRPIGGRRGWRAGGQASRWSEIWRDSWCRTELGGTADAAWSRADLYVRNGNAQMANSGNGQGKWARRRKKPATC